jgi:hypothetical protein
VWVTVFVPLLIMALALVMERVEAPLARRDAEPAGLMPSETEVQPEVSVRLAP